MTINERLYISHRMNDFDIATKIKDIEKIKHILRELEVDEKSIIEIIDKIKISPDDEIK